MNTALEAFKLDCKQYGKPSWWIVNHGVGIGKIAYFGFEKQSIFWYVTWNGANFNIVRDESISHIHWVTTEKAYKEFIKDYEKVRYS